MSEPNQSTAYRKFLPLALLALIAWASAHPAASRAEHGSPAGPTSAGSEGGGTSGGHGDGALGCYTAVQESLPAESHADGFRTYCSPEYAGCVSYFYHQRQYDLDQALAVCKP